MKTMKHVQFHKQETKYTCGAAAMRMVLGACGIVRTEKQVAKLLGTNTVRGTWNKSFPLVAEKFLLGYVVTRDASIKDLRRLQKEKYATIICYYIPEDKVDHYAVVKSIGTKSIALLDPWYGPDHTLPLKKFAKQWKSNSKYDNEKQWCIGIRKPRGTQR